MPGFDSKKEDIVARYPWLGDGRPNAARSSGKRGTSERSPTRRTAGYPRGEDRGERGGDGSRRRDRSRSRSPHHGDWRRDTARGEHDRSLRSSHLEQATERPETWREYGRSRYDYDVRDRWDPEAQGGEEDTRSRRSGSRSRSRGGSQSPSRSRSNASNDGDWWWHDDRADGEEGGRLQPRQSRQSGASDLSRAYGSWGSYLAASWDVRPPFLRPCPK